MVLRRMFLLLFWKILTVSTSLWDHCQYTPGYSKMNICNASMNAPYICFECLKRFACALTSSSYAPVSDTACEVSPVLIVCWTLFLHLQICDVSNHASVNPETQLMIWWVFQQLYPVIVCHGSVCESQCHKRRYFPLILSWLSAVICSARPHAHYEIQWQLHSNSTQFKWRLNFHVIFKAAWCHSLEINYNVECQK